MLSGYTDFWPPRRRDVRLRTRLRLALSKANAATASATGSILVTRQSAGMANIRVLRQSHPAEICQAVECGYRVTTRRLALRYRPDPLVTRSKCTPYDMRSSNIARRVLC